jgi:uncharacterized protein
LPLLMCPNCQTGMQSLTRSSVEFDMCPSCRGVWLDRGELEKLVEDARAGAAPIAAAPQARPGPAPGGYGREYGQRGEYGEQGEYSEQGHDPRRKRKRGMDIFDIFD